MKKDFLESLIGLLSASEKRYVGEHLSMRKEDNHFSALFSSVVSGKNTPAIKRMKLKEPNTYYVTKSKLQKKISKLLRMCHSDASREQAMKNICIDVEILFHKGAFLHCQNLIDSALKVCEKCEWFELELYLLSWREKILFALLNTHTLKDDLNTNLKRVKVALSKLTELQYHKQFIYDMLVFVKRVGIPKKSSELAKLHKIIHRYKHSSAQKRTSYRARICYCLTYTYYYFALQEHTKYYEYSQKHVKVVELFQKAAGIPMPEQLSVTLQNLIICELQLKKYTELQQSLHKIRAIKFNSKGQEATLFTHTYSIETHLYARTGQFDKIQNILHALKQGLSKYEHLITKEQEAILHYNISYLFFGSGQYSQALQWNNKILNDSSINVREDLYCFARILNLIIHYELGNAQLLEHLALSTYRYLYKRNRVFEMESIIMKFIRHQLTHYRPYKQITGSLQQLLSTVKKLCATNKGEQAALENFDFISYLESKIENRPFADIVKEKAKKAN